MHTKAKAAISCFIYYKFIREKRRVIPFGALTNVLNGTQYDRWS